LENYVTVPKVVPASEFILNFARCHEGRRSFATAELPEEKIEAISSSRMDERHTPLDVMVDPE